jgi:hypothetical protein
MRRLHAYLLCGLLLTGAGPLALVPSAAVADTPTTQIPRDQHVWAKFGKGSWKRVRVRTETVDEQGRRTGETITDTKTTIDKVEDDGVTLRVETSVEVEGKRFDSPVQTVRQGYNGQAIGQMVSVQPQSAETLTIDNKQFPCQVWQVQLGGAESKRTSRVFYSAAVAPYILRRESTWNEPSRPGAMNETINQVIALDMPYRVLDEVHSTAFEKTVYRNSQGTATTVSVTSPDVPGGVVAYTSKEVDLNERLIRRSTLELVDYGIEGEDSHQARQRIPRRERRRNNR